MKKLTFILAALALTLGLSQCKKAETPTTDEGVFITLTAGYGNGAKTGFTPATGAFVWTNGQTEYIYVGGSQHDACLGALSGTGNGTGSMTFSGTLTTTPNEGETLHFFYLGKGRNGSAVSTLDFSTQYGSIENVTNYHIAIGDGSYSSSTINYATTLNMAMSIAYFDVNGFKNASDVAETVYLHGDEVYSTATINYSEGTITGNAKGSISLGTATAGKYVALIPSVNTETTLKFDSDSKTGAMTFLRGIQAGKYYANSDAALSVAANNPMDEGALPGLYSVSATKKVRFSKGNLQYKDGEGWRFAEHQYGCVDYHGTWDPAEWIDLFCFGKWGRGQNPIETIGPFEWIDDFSGTIDGQSDWRTTTIDEWKYLLQERADASQKHAAATVNEVHGLVLLPDNWTLPTGSSFNAGFVSEWATNNYNSDQWLAMESAGALFLPAAGEKSNTSNSVTEVGDLGRYWSSTTTRRSGVYVPNHMYFIKNSFNPDSWDNYRAKGRSVRLVRDIE